MMAMRNLTLSHVVAIGLLVALFYGSPAQAAVFFDDSFENHLMPNWTTGSCSYMGYSVPPADGCNPQISTDMAHDASHSLKGNYTGLDSGVWIDRYYSTTDEVWTRFYYQTTNFTYDPTAGTKHFNLGDNVHYPNFWGMNVFGSREMGITSQLEASGSNVNYQANVNHVPLNDGQWYCIETHIKMNTPGVADGVLELYVNGTTTLSYSGRTFRSTTPDCNSCSSSNATFSFLRLFVQHGVGSMYYDQFATGNTRIGCSSTSTSPPPAPTGLSVQ